ncbi:112aa long hypothetical protein [Pyrococcus horikoshii OT3]|uniref:Uncharacterized protein n=1 Tax=Pyrococcus horikoshii (strain ATCC 700860 / DSM 12428 / JCM 9974 / NBRC 100139 / OT-3) TaxID=70601 RepID=O59290_PYRHO|nr:112aa long hypothetical protein [Pyrococcus horikoshii OT3]
MTKAPSSMNNYELLLREKSRDFIGYAFHHRLSKVKLPLLIAKHATSNLYYYHLETSSILNPSLLTLVIIGIPPAIFIAVATSLCLPGAKAYIHPPPPAPVSFAPIAPAVLAA